MNADANNVRLYGRISLDLSSCEISLVVARLHEESWRPLRRSTAYCLNLLSYGGKKVVRMCWGRGTLTGNELVFCQGLSVEGVSLIVEQMHDDCASIDDGAGAGQHYRVGH